MKKKRRNYSSKEKVVILKRHLLDRGPVSDLCEEYDLHITVFYRWQKEFFENGASAFEKENKAREKAEAERSSQLEKKLQKKNEVLSELMEAHLQLKKEPGVH